MSLLEDPLPLEPGNPSVATTHWWLMEWAGCVWATMLVIPIGLVLIIAPHVLLIFFPKLAMLRESWESGIRWTLIVLWILLDVPFLWRLWSSWSNHGNHEMILHVAGRQPLLPAILRPLVAMWWMGHFALALVLGAFTEKIAPVDPPTVAVTFLLLGMFWCAFASNIFLIHAVTALTRGPAVQRVWNWRGVYDLGLVAVGVVWRLAARH